MKIQLSDPELVDNLLLFLERAGVQVTPSTAETVIALLGLPDESATRAELDGYLRAWQAMNPNTAVEVGD